VPPSVQISYSLPGSSSVWLMLTLHKQQFSSASRTWATFCTFRSGDKMKRDGFSDNTECTKCPPTPQVEKRRLAHVCIYLQMYARSTILHLLYQQETTAISLRYQLRKNNHVANFSMLYTCKYVSTIQRLFEHSVYSISMNLLW
jgi:hypothetical protein